MVWRNARILQYPRRRTNVSSSLCWHGSGLWLSISCYVGTWTFHCDPAGNEWRTAHCNSKSLRSAINPPPGVRNKWNDSTIKYPMFSLRQIFCLATKFTSSNKPHVASLTWASCAVHISTDDISNQFTLLPIFMSMTLFRNNPLRWAATGIFLLQIKVVYIQNVHAAAVVVVSIAHYGTRLVSSLCEYPVFSEWRTCNDDRFHRCFPVDTDVNRHLVHLGTFIHVSFAFMRRVKIQIWILVV